MVSIGERNHITHERDRSLKNLLKKRFLSRWISPLDKSGNEVDSNPNNEGKFLNKRSTSMDFARPKESIACEDVVSGISEILNEIINEAKLVKTALGSSLPISWLGEGDAGYPGDNAGTNTTYQECTKGL
ncbi:hypothetical protein AHAS_AhasUnG0017600 [Arachis hypogaea]